MRRLSSPQAMNFVHSGFESVEQFVLCAAHRIAALVILMDEVEGQQQAVVVDGLIEGGGSVGECCEAGTGFAEGDDVAEGHVVGHPISVPAASRGVRRTSSPVDESTC